MDKNQISGVIEAEPKTIVFSTKENSFEFFFMTDSVLSFSQKNIMTCIPSKEGFIHGKTHDNQDIAIYLGRSSYEFLNVGHLNTAAYILSDSNIYDINLLEFDAIAFSGGTMNKVFDINGLTICESEDAIVLKRHDDSKTYSVDIYNCKINIDIRSVIHEQRGVSGTKINNSDVVFTLTFSSPQPLSKFFYYYNKVRDILSFLVFRDNVGFDKIFLQKTNQEMGIPLSCAEIFIRNDSVTTDKDPFHCISINDLGDSFPNLIKVFFEEEEDTESYSLGFIPQNDRDFYTMNNTKLRAVCTSLDCEWTLDDNLHQKKESQLDGIIKFIKKAIKECRKEHTEISEKTYNSFLSFIGNKAFPFSDKVFALYHKYEKEALILNPSQIHISDELIEKLVKYRNSITHGRHITMESNTAITAIVLCGVVYCSILNRIGLNRNQILKLCEHKITK